jgi:hypothetical protein
MYQCVLLTMLMLLLLLLLLPSCSLASDYCRRNVCRESNLTLTSLHTQEYTFQRETLAANHHVLWVRRTTRKTEHRLSSLRYAALMSP